MILKILVKSLIKHVMRMSDILAKLSQIGIERLDNSQPPKTNSKARSDKKLTPSGHHKKLHIGG
jgi:hypothetical protein